ncbi:hypothetical protein SAY87_012259 [Trapa incisa]|uniref:Uncharacterized protein n=1 Tax=Trapa incisa TaxID=236973 RepID=A0AAN7H0V0_9MYRT|nr:hypothetical protein SAY87_012259 [Trapa incisa]
MATSSVPATSSCNGSPRHAVGTIATRRRVADPYDPADRLSDDEENVTIAVNHLHHHHHHYQPVRYPVLRRKLFMGVPESVLHKIENLLFWSCGAAERMRSRRNLGRKILGFLIVLVVISLFVKVSFLSYVHSNRRSVGSGFLRLHAFKDDWAQAQRAVTEEAFLPKLVVEKLPTPEIWMKSSSENYHQCITRPRNRISMSIAPKFSCNANRFVAELKYLHGIIF